MSYIKKEKIEEIKEKSDIISVVSDYVSLKKVEGTIWEIVLFIVRKHLLFSLSRNEYFSLLWMW